MFKPISGSVPANQTQPLGNAIQALRKAPQQTAASRASAHDSAEISDGGKAASAKAKSENQVEMAVREAARRPGAATSQAAVLSASRMLREHMIRATA